MKCANEDCIQEPIAHEDRRGIRQEVQVCTQPERTNLQKLHQELLVPNAADQVRSPSIYIVLAALANCAPLSIVCCGSP